MRAHAALQHRIQSTCSVCVLGIGFCAASHSIVPSTVNVATPSQSLNQKIQTFDIQEQKTVSSHLNVAFSRGHVAWQLGVASQRSNQLTCHDAMTLASHPLDDCPEVWLSLAAAQQGWPHGCLNGQPESRVGQGRNPAG